MNESSRRNRWPVALAAGLAGIVLGIACTLFFLRSERKLPSSDDVLAASPGVEPLLVCFGHVDLEHGVMALGPLRPGRVVEVLVQDGQAVPAGTVLLRLDDEQARSQVQQAEADLQASRARLAQMRKLPEQHQADLDLQRALIQAAQARQAAAVQLLQRKRSLFDRQLVDASEVKVATEGVSEADASLAAEQQKLRKLELLQPAEQIAQVEAETEAKQARLQEAKHVLAECSLRTPVDGQVLRMLATRGEILGGPSSQPAVYFCPDRPPIVRAEVSQEFANRVAVGQSCLIQDEFQLGEKWQGQLARISNWLTQRRSILQEPLQRNDVRTLECIIRLEPGQKPLRIGQRMRVTISS